MSPKRQKHRQPEKIIIGGGEKGFGKQVKCNDCGKLAMISGENIGRANKAKVLCPVCGLKILKKIGKKDNVMFPPRAEIKKILEMLIKNKTHKKNFLQQFISRTLYCKSCGEEFGHETVAGAMMLNTTKVGYKSPKHSEELNFGNKKIKKEIDYGGMVS